MPILGSSAYQVVSNMLQATRVLLNDPTGNVFSDLALLPLFNNAYNTLWTELENNGDETLIADYQYFTVPAIQGNDPSAVVVVSDTAVFIEQSGGAVSFVNPAEAGPPNLLPGNILRPIKAWERPVNTFSDFVEMDDRTSKGGLPGVGAGSSALGMFEWTEDGFVTPGASSDVEVRLRSQIMLVPAADGTASIAIRNGQNYLEFRTAYLASLARGSSMAQTWLELSNEAMDQLTCGVVRTIQKPRRRRAHSSGGRSSGWI